MGVDDPPMNNASGIAQEVANNGTPLFAYVALLVGLAVGLAVLVALALKSMSEAMVPTATPSYPDRRDVERRLTPG